ncbi:endopeptidase La [Stomatobaculum sp. F0698]|uniref:endopeptidase La n=1 Tax=Stomatobaculum sp. F0698 TaxID=3059030 RepID=UPI00272A57CA|nr:endopeptidase La [Stomatobaculum sp. F0698]WLD86007.1 endopeptidase La [Stomatobaculum sp. F0698]
MAVVPVYNILAVPGANIPLSLERFEKMIGRVPVSGERVTLIFMKEDKNREELNAEDFYTIGVSGTVTEVGDQGVLVFRCNTRVDLKSINIYPDHSIDLDVERRQDIEDLDDAVSAKRLKHMKQLMLEAYGENPQFGPMLRGMISRWASLGDIAGIVNRWLINSPEEKMAVLSEDSRNLREQKLEELLRENLEFHKVNTEANSAQEEEYQKMYRENALKKQIEYLQKQLDSLHPEKVSDLRRFELKIQDLGMNESAKAEAEKVLKRLQQEGQQTAESGMLYDYLDYVTNLPWKKESAQEIDLAAAEQVLEEDHYGLKKVKNRILQQIAVMSLKGQQSGSILLFVGAPGTGKTSIGASIARALGRKYVRVSLGGVRDEADIRGHRRTYIGAMAGRIIDGIKKSGVSNPVMVLDEVDKLSTSFHGDPASALLEVLDPEQNHSFTDHYLNVPYDLSDVLFVCTANSAETIPGPLLNRMEVIPFQGYSPLEKKEIAKRHLLPKALEAVGLTAEQLEIGDDILETLISDYTRESGVRGLKRCLDKLCRGAAVRFVRDKQTLTVTKENLRELMDSHPLPHRAVRAHSTPGVVTGLAWTAVGGEILYIETMFTKGSGKIHVTGQLGSVMKESAELAVSKVKALFPEEAQRFSENDLHIHVPDGATPKDGPSAGITLTTALASLVTGKPVPATVGMTGEVSLQSEVKPIGGLPEKLMAAERAGVKTVFIPADNEQDLADVAPEVLEKLEVIPVREVSEVLTRLGLLEKA